MLPNNYDNRYNFIILHRLLLFAKPKTWKEILINESVLSNIIKLIDTNETYIIINNTAKNIKQITSKIIYQKLILETSCLPTSTNGLNTSYLAAKAIIDEDV